MDWIEKIIDDFREDWVAIKDAISDVIWWWKDLKAERERKELARMEEKHKEQSEIVPLEIADMEARAKRIDAETLLIKN